LLPAVVREKALAVGAHRWIERLPDLVRSLEAEWEIAVGRAFRDSTEAPTAHPPC
jgi:streptomycin 6-kinase